MPLCFKEFPKQTTLCQTFCEVSFPAIHMPSAVFVTDLVQNKVRLVQLTSEVISSKLASLKNTVEQTEL